MNDVEVYFRAALLAIGLLLIGVGVACRYAGGTKDDGFVPIGIMGFGALCIAAATDGVD